MKKPLLALAAAFALAFGLLIVITLSASATSDMSVMPWTYYNGESFGEGTHGTVTSKCTPAGLFLAKTEDSNAAAGATVGGIGVAGILVNDLGWDILAGSHFSGGAPRFNVVTQDLQTHFFGFSAATTASGAPTGYQRYGFDLSATGDGNTQLAEADRGIVGKKVLSIDIAFDETGEATVKNIDVNDNILNCVVAVVTTPTPTPTPSASASATPHPSPTAVPVLAQTGGGTPVDSTSPWQAFAGLGLVVLLIGGGMLFIRRLRRS